MKPWYSFLFPTVSPPTAKPPPEPLHINAKGLNLIRLSEGYSAIPYLCSSGVPTIGIGTTIGEDGCPITLDHPRIDPVKAEMLFRRDIELFSRSIRNLCKVPLNNNQFSALCSLCYNIGAGNFRASTLLRKLNRGDYDGCAAEFWKWRRSKGIINRGLVLRRERERVLFCS